MKKILALSFWIPPLPKVWRFADCRIFERKKLLGIAVNMAVIK